MDLKIEVKGLREIETQLLKLEATVARRALNQALRSASNKVVKNAKQRAPGSIKKSIFASRKVMGITVISKDTAAQLTIGVHSKGPKASPHAHLIEYGTKRRRTKEKAQTLRNIARGRTTRKRVVRIAGKYYSLGTDRGKVKGRYFMRSAWRLEGEKKYIGRFQKTLTRKIEKLSR